MNSICRPVACICFYPYAFLSCFNRYICPDQYSRSWLNLLGGRNSNRQGERKKSRETERGTIAPLPLFIYTPKDSRLRFLAPKHTSRFLFLSEVPHSTKRLGDRAEASWGQRTSVHPPAFIWHFTRWPPPQECMRPWMRGRAYVFVHQKCLSLQDM